MRDEHRMLLPRESNMRRRTQHKRGGARARARVDSRHFNRSKMERKRRERERIEWAGVKEPALYVVVLPMSALDRRMIKIIVVRNTCRPSNLHHNARERRVRNQFQSDVLFIAGRNGQPGFFCEAVE